MTGHIYTLYCGKKAVYVGKTTLANPFSRIRQHYSEKNFDRVVIVKCEMCELAEMEASLIKKHNPMYNTHYAIDTRKPYRPKYPKI